VVGLASTLLTAALLLAVAGLPARAQFYKAGDIVQEFSLIDRTTRQPVTLSSLEGKIVFVEWFAWWCTFCQIAAPQVESGIVDYYETRSGNPDGIPVVHVAINLQRGQESQTQNFIDNAGFGLVLEDFDRGLARRFQSGGQPIFAIINGVTNSASHRPWELLLHQNGYGTTAQPLERFRAAIDGVKGPALVPPAITLQPEGRSAKVGDQVHFTVEASGTGPLQYQWFKDGQPLANATEAVLRFEAVALADTAAYEVEVRNAGGRQRSQSAALSVRASPPAPRLAAGRRVTDGSFEFEVLTGAGQVCRVEQSPDLRAWSFLTRFTAAGDTWLIRAPHEPGRLAQFYRVIAE
jgi:hypothetical protein